MASIYSRVSLGRGCPYCAGQRVLPGENDLATQCPAVAAKWDYAKNGGVTPSMVTASSHRKYWWLCERGHSWNAAIYSLTNNSGCPYCAGKRIIQGVNDLATVNPALASEWDEEKNDVSAREVLAGSIRKAWWICPAGHSYEAHIYSRASGTKCPYCTNKRVLAGYNDLATTNPEVAAQWHPQLNGSLTPEMVTKGSSRKAWWICREGHVWQAAIFSRTRDKASDCPICSGRYKQKSTTERVKREVQIIRKKQEVRI